jgi:cytochrome P450
MDATITPDKNPEPLVFDPTSMAYTINPQPLFEKLRSESPIHYVEQFDGWLLTRHEYIVEALSGKAFAISPPQGSGHQTNGTGANIDTPTRDWFYAHNPFLTEDETHQTARRMLSRVFSVTNINKRKPLVDKVVADYFAPLHQARHTNIDLVPLVKYIPNAVLRELLGIDQVTQSREKLDEIMHGFKSIFNPLLNEEGLLAVEACTSELYKIICHHIVLRRQQPGEDLISLLIEAAEDEDGGFDNDMIAVMVLTVFVVGSDTTLYQGLLCSMMLFQQPGLYTLLQTERHHLEAAIAEMVRYQNAGKVLFRYAQEDYNFHGHTIKKGQTLFAPVNAANWDKDVISNPEVFDIHRKQNLSIPFGKGIHFCLGANLARLELASILEQLLDNLPEGSSLDLDNIDWRCDDFIIREITRLVVLVN